MVSAVSAISLAERRAAAGRIARTGGAAVRSGDACGVQAIEKTTRLSHVEEIVRAEATSEDIEQLKQAVVSFVERKGFGCWALGKCLDPSLKPLFISVLRRQLPGDVGELFEAMIALSNLGEDVFDGEESRSSLAVEHNRQLAEAYLER
jgi:hypothetical protein